ncbi:translation initiation factor IF-2 [Nitzschia inconspicua]|uniref:Eukaryotic translation initiation factor 5B n=1 Tax=Nitzschia inconspicua TaxID=303405 RepID=A0A9K3LIS6_9STRA|nr:translation initiation factor IF-2 [Nitzschia inconspicua]
MGKKNKNKKGGPQQDDDDDWEALLEAESKKNEASMPDNSAAAAATTTTEESSAEPANKESEPTGDQKPAATDAAAAFLAAQGLAADDGDDGAKNKKKKKKKKGGTAAAGGGEKKEDEKISARGKLVQERLRKQQEEAERIRAAEEAERQRIAEIERQEAEEERKKQEERERKRLKQKEKIERQKREGTYMTKKQKEKAKLAEQRLEAMRAAGMLPTEGQEGYQAPEKKRVVYDNRKKGKGRSQQQQDDEEEDDAVEESREELKQGEKGPTQEPEAAVVEEAKPTEEQAEEEDDWEKEDDDKKDEAESGDEWDADSDSDDDKFADLAARLEKVAVENEDVDLVELEKKKEQERLKELGRKRAEQERLEEERMAKVRAEQDAARRAEQIKAQKREEGRRKREEQERANLAARSPDNLRCPIVVIMGHVDTGKTKLLDKIRKTNVQEGEAGGITQQIGATFFEKKTLEAQTAKLNQTEQFDIKIPGMLVIDTPGHESFSNLRSRGSSLCDVAILVVDLMHGLEQQTIESLNMLRQKKVPFVVALNKVDRCYAWKTCKDTPIRDALKEQEAGTISEFRNRALDAKVQLQEQGVNSNLYWEMGDDDWSNSDFIPLVPTSAITGEGVQDVLMLLCQMAQRKIWKHIMWCANLEATVLEVKAIDGLGMTVDVLVVNGYLREGDKAVFCTLDGPIITEIRGLLTPPPSREMRVKSDYLHHKEVKGALGVKVIGNGLEKVMAGTPVMVVGPNDEEEDIKAEVMSDLTNLQSKLSTDRVGVLVQASTLGALEALLQFLREETQPPIPVSAIGIGTIHKRDVTKISIMNEKGHPEYATILAFDVDIEREAREHAQEMGVRIMTAEIIYHLFDQFTRFMDELTTKRREEATAIAVFPSIIKILPQHVFNQKDPIIVGVEVLEGILKVGTPLCVPALGGLHVGKVTSIESNGREQQTAKKGASVAIKITNESNPNITYGRQFDASHSLYSTLTRESINALKANFKDALENEDWRLVIKLKKVFNII